MKYMSRKLLHITLGLLTIPISLVSYSLDAHAAGGGGDTPGGSGNGGTLVSPLSNGSSGFSFSQQIQGYGNVGGCGIQGTLSGNYGTLTAPYSSTVDNISSIGQANTHGYTIGANITFNSQKCTDPNKQLELQKVQIQAQKLISCNQERGKIANLLLTQNPKATAQEVATMLEVICK
jgi:hypothetical protein